MWKAAGDGEWQCDPIVGAIVEWLNENGVPVAFGGIFMCDTGLGSISISDDGKYAIIKGSYLEQKAELAAPDCLEHIMGAVLLAFNAKQLMLDVLASFQQASDRSVQQAGGGS